MAGKQTKHNQQLRTLEQYNERHKIHIYQDIWNKALGCKWFPLSALKEFKMNETDIANMIYNIDYLDIQSFRALVATKSETAVYIPTNGIWIEQTGNEELRQLIKRFRVVLEREVIDRIKLLIHENEQIKGQDRDEDHDTDKEFLIDKLKLYTSLYVALGEKKQEGVIKQLVHRLVMETKLTDFTLDTFNRASGFIAFTDGVYSFEKKALIPNNEAIDLNITVSCGLEYEKVANVDAHVMLECTDFLTKIMPCRQMRRWTLRRLHKALARINEKLVLIWHGNQGNNGKSRLIQLIDRALGELYKTGPKKLLNPESGNRTGGANEDIMYMKYGCVFAWSEPAEGKPLNTSFIKEWTGGDAIVARRLFKGSEKFMGGGLMIIACNTIPNLDATDKGIFNRIRCVPFLSEFVMSANEVNEEEHKYLADEDIDQKFDQWKYALMRIILDATEDVEPPEAVLEHTKQFNKRENVMLRFCQETMETGGKDDFVRLPDLWEEFKKWRKEEHDFKCITMKRSDFLETMMVMFQKEYIKDTRREGLRIVNGISGYKLKVEQQFNEYLINDDIDDDIEDST